jgi:hypothetical protein
LKNLDATVRGTVAGDGSTEPNLYFLPTGENATKSGQPYLANKSSQHQRNVERFKISLLEI